MKPLLPCEARSRVLTKVRCLYSCALSLVAVGFAFISFASDRQEPEQQKSDTDRDFAIQGEYAGLLSDTSGGKKLGVQVIALGNGRFRSVGYPGGLPGDGWIGGGTEEVEAEFKDGKVTFEGSHAIGVIADGVVTMVDFQLQPFGELERLNRKSPTQGAQPPEGAVVLFDGTSPDQFVSPQGGPAKMTGNGLLMQGANSKQQFGDQQLHLEFQLPFQPEARGQKRGNSGCYLQGRYEIQMLDSFGLAGKNNECGGIYGIKDPDINMCFPPRSWQTFDVEFTAAKFNGAGEKMENARMTVKHNGVVIHDDVELPKKTTAAPLDEGPLPGFLHLQDHGNPVRYRNIWVLEK